MEQASHPIKPHSTVVAPLQHEPRRIRPPFNVDGHEACGRADRVAALLEALDGVELGAYDRRIIDWLADWDNSVVGTVASLFYRVRVAGASDGAQ